MVRPCSTDSISPLTIKKQAKLTTRDGQDQQMYCLHISLELQVGVKFIVGTSLHTIFT